MIYAETKFEPRTSSAGAEGLMQIEPETAEFLAKLSGGYSFTTSDLGTPKINVAYGSYYLRYLLDHYEGNEMLAVAAYNAGLANVDKWVAKARAEGGELTIDDDPLPGDARVRAARARSAEGIPRDVRSAAGARLAQAFSVAVPRRAARPRPTAGARGPAPARRRPLGPL